MALAYLSGSVPYGVVLTRLVAGVDVRQVGSGNIGATNAARAGGKKLGVVVLSLDVLKAVVPILVARGAAGRGAPRGGWVTAVAVAAFVGHVFPVWLRFQGGKGVATGLGIFLVLAPWAALAGVAGLRCRLPTTRISSPARWPAPRCAASAPSPGTACGARCPGPAWSSACWWCCATARTSGG